MPLARHTERGREGRAVSADLADTVANGFSVLTGDLEEQARAGGAKEAKHWLAIKQADAVRVLPAPHC